MATMHSGPLDGLVGEVVATLDDGIELRRLLGEPEHGRVHTTGDGRQWTAVAESVVGGQVVPTPSAWHWRSLRPSQRSDARAGGPLVAPELVAEIEQAVALFARVGDPVHAALLRAVRSALPPIHHFGQLLSDAWAVLHGDTAAADRFLDAVEALDAASASVPGHADRIGELADALRRLDDVRLEDLLHDAAQPRRRRGDVPAGHEVVLVLAALHAIPGGDPGEGARLAAVVHDQVCGYEAITLLHRSAVRAVAGDGAARLSLWGQLRLAGGPPLPDDALSWPGPPSPPLPQPPAPGPVGPKPPLPYPDIAPRWPPFRGFDPCVLLAVKTLKLPQNRYTVTAVSPPRACPGESITIAGSGFGSAPARSASGGVAARWAPRRSR